MEAGSLSLSSYYLGPITAKVVVWLPGLLVAEGVGQSSTFIWYDYCPPFVYSVSQVDGELL